MPTVPDWQLPPGVSRGLWDYLHDADLARGYDDSLVDSSLCQVDQAFAEKWFDRPGRLIDLGCGTGRLLIPFARRGYPAVGVDLSRPMLAVAAEKASRVGVQVDWVCANLVDLRALADGSFDYAACLFSTLGMIHGAQERGRFLAHVRRLLRPGGRFVVHVHNRWFNFWRPAGRRWLWRDTWRSWTNSPESGDCSMPVHQNIAGLSLHLFTRREILGHLKQAGFRILESRPISLQSDGTLRRPAWFGWLRAYGYLIAAQRLP